MSHADAWARVGLDLLNGWRLIPIFLVSFGARVSATASAGEDGPFAEFLHSVGVLWLIIIIGFQAGWWS